MSPIWSRSITQLRADFDRGTISPVEVVAACLERIAQVNPTLNAHWHVAADTALSAARGAAERLRAGTGRPLEGVPIGVKDTIDVAGMPCTLGSKQYSGRVATGDATVVRRLREAGAIILTKDATSEFALGSPYSPIYGLTRNPWHPGHWAGGSSAGGAAGVAAGCLPAAIGTDAGGSVRAPASWSGITGLKPTKGRISRAGVASVTWTMCTVGSLARTARDAGLILAVISGEDPADPQSVAAPALSQATPTYGLDGVRIGVCWDWAARDADAREVDALRRTAAVLQEAGADIVDLPTPGFSEHVGRIGYHILHIEAAFALAEHRAASGLDPALLGRIDQGRFVSADSYLRALRYRVTVQNELAGLTQGLDALLLPTTTSTAPEPDGTGGVKMNVNGRTTSVGGGLSPWTVTFNLAGYPAIAMPTGIADGLPLSAQIVAAPFAEDVCVRIAAEFQRLTDFHRAAPSWPPHATALAPLQPESFTTASGDSPVDPAHLGQWFGEPVTEHHREAVSGSLAEAQRDMLTLHALGTESCVGGLLDPHEGEAFLRSYLPRASA